MCQLSSPNTYTIVHPPTPCMCSFVVYLAYQGDNSLYAQQVISVHVHRIIDHLHGIVPITLLILSAV